MTKEEFCALPLCIALEALYEAVPELQYAPAPTVPRKPKYDGRLGKGNQGFVWMSEMTFDDLLYWYTKNQSGSENGGAYAERNAKTARALLPWIEWRRCYPTDQWWGTRGEERVTAPPPRRNPKVHPWPANGNGPRRQQGSGSNAAPPDDSDDDLDDLNF